MRLYQVTFGKGTVVFVEADSEDTAIAYAVNEAATNLPITEVRTF